MKLSKLYLGTTAIYAVLAALNFFGAVVREHQFAKGFAIGFGIGCCMLACYSAALFAVARSEENRRA